MSLSRTTRALSLAVTLVALSACSGDAPAPPSDGASGAPPMPASAWAAGPLEGAIDVAAARESAADGDEVVLKGRLQDFGRLATFKLVDASLEPCVDECATPWDYCCEEPDTLSRNTVNVEFLEDGVPGDWSLRGERGLDHLSEVVVAGTLRIDEAGNMRLEADRIAAR